MSAAAYDFKNLSPEDFERLCADLLSRLWQVRLEVFKSGRDRGVDLRASVNGSPDGALIVQCKRYPLNAFSRLLRILVNDELPKISMLDPKRYVVATSVSLSVSDKDQVVESLSPYCLGGKDVFGADDLNLLLRQFPEVERAHFKLWISSTQVLETLLRAGVWNLTSATVDDLNARVARFVVHDGFDRALDMLQEHHYCLIVGVPGIGKTTLAEMLLLHYVHEGFTPVIVSNDIEEAWSVLNSAAVNQQPMIVLYDDFLGQVSLDANKLGKNEESRLLSLMALCKKRPSLRLLLTTREYILADAQRQHARLAASDFSISKFTLILAHYSGVHRSRILFNHLYFSDLPRSRLQALVTSKTYRTIVSHRNFSPRIVEAISRHANFHSLDDESFIREVTRQLDDPASIWSAPFDTQISHDSQILLVVLWSVGGLTSLEALRTSFARWLSLREGSDLQRRFEGALRALDGNFITTDRCSELGRSDRWHRIAKFHNPSIRDFLARRIAAERGYIDDLINCATQFEQLIACFAVLKVATESASAHDCFERSLELLGVESSLRVTRFGGETLVRREAFRLIDRLPAIVEMGVAVNRIDELAKVLWQRLHPLDAMLAASPPGTRQQLRRLIDICEQQQVFGASQVLQLRRAAAALAQDELSRAAWMAEAADAVELLSSQPEVDRAVLASAVRGIAESVLGEIRDGSVDLDEASAERDWLAQCGGVGGVDVEDLLAEFDEAIDALSISREVDDFDERRISRSSTVEEFDIDGLFSSLLERDLGC